MRRKQANYYFLGSIDPILQPSEQIVFHISMQYIPVTVACHSSYHKILMVVASIGLAILVQPEQNCCVSIK